MSVLGRIFPAAVNLRDTLTGGSPTSAPEVRFTTAPGGHLGVLTGRRARGITRLALDTFLDDHG